VRYFCSASGAYAFTAGAGAGAIALHPALAPAATRSRTTSPWRAHSVSSRHSYTSPVN
jgi:hypothetical protein